MDMLTDIATLANCVKWVAYAALLWLCTAALSGCGVKAGQSFVVGTTGFLDVAQQGQVEHPEAEKRELRRLVAQ